MIQIKDLNKTYGEGTNAVHALRNCNVEFEYGKFTASAVSCSPNEYWWSRVSCNSSRARTEI